MVFEGWWWWFGTTSLRLLKISVLEHEQAWIKHFGRARQNSTILDKGWRTLISGHALMPAGLQLKLLSMLVLRFCCLRHYCRGSHLNKIFCLIGGALALTQRWDSCHVILVKKVIRQMIMWLVSIFSREIRYLISLLSGSCRHTVSVLA